MTKNNDAPSIRFKSFSDTWEQRKLGEIGSTYTGLSGKSAPDFGHGNAKFITYMNVFKNPIADLSMVDSIEVDPRQNEVEVGDVFFTTSSETPEEVGMSSVLLEKEGNIYLNSFCFGYRPTEKIDPHYLAFMLRSDVVREKIVFLAQGISRYNISKNKMMEITVPLPCLKEQEQIGALFSELDNLITLHQHKLDKLNIVKKSMLKKMFPQNGSKFPEIRFNGFTDAWKQRKIGDISTITAGGTPSTAIKSYWYPKQIPWLSSGEVHGKYLFTTNNKISEEGLNNSSAKWIEKGSVLIALAGQGKTRGTAAISRINMTTNQSIAAIKFTSDIYPDYAFHNLDSRYIELRNVSSGDGTRGGLNKQMLSDLEIMFPSYEEQVMIGDLFTSIDNLITLHQQKLETLKKIKISMLEKMFV